MLRTLIMPSSGVLPPQEYKLVSDTLFLAISYIDRFLSLHPVPRQQLQLVGVSCMLLAAKYEEIYAPQVNSST